ncbi:MAG: SDR family NAD(P)-dependent oxidoreductase [Nitrospinota bacterium]
MRLKDRVAIVTGGARGIGRTYVRALAAQGAKVVAADIDEDGEAVNEVRKAGGEVTGLTTDVSDEASTLAMARGTVETHGRIDILVNNAAIAGRFATIPVERTSVEFWDRIMAVNAKGMFLCSKAVLPTMKAQRSGKIINISSHSLYLGIPGMLAYTTSKGCVLAFTRALAREVGDYGIAVNALAPAVIHSEDEVKENPEQVERVNQARCFKRSLEPADLVGTLLYLASEDSGFVTGQSLLVNGGAYFH